MSEHAMDEMIDRPTQSLRTVMAMTGQAAEHVARARERAERRRSAELAHDGAQPWEGMHRKDTLEQATPEQTATAYEAARRAAEHGDDRAEATAEAIEEHVERTTGVDLADERQQAQRAAEQVTDPTEVLVQASDPQWREQATDADLVRAWATAEGVQQDPAQETLHAAAADAQQHVEEALTERTGVDAADTRERLQDALGVEAEARAHVERPTTEQVTDSAWREQATDAELVAAWSVAQEQREQDPARWAGVRDTIEGEMSARGGAAAHWAERAETMRAGHDLAADRASDRADGEADRLRAESQQQWQEHVTEEKREHRAEDRAETAQQRAEDHADRGQDAAADRAESRAGAALGERDMRNDREDRAEDRSRLTADKANTLSRREESTPSRFDGEAARKGGASREAIDARETSSKAFGRSTTDGIQAGAKRESPARNIVNRAREHGRER